ncbi:transglycosylase SLT domain-containing protein [Streptomyces sp. 900105755]|uniref:transglycosylase SLT domain-containing protein n=1 Tax=unclassified Streptomyces TaxID=2593676 RepID=UPI00089D9AAA|nr:transglycosylase SLT domain-containing protein [Streptomyces sp. Ag109_O5-10]SEF12572.1 Transglycosylase SLT domain-containing protein [Streptomyces sp. Ag109_O5-10]
MPKHAHSPTLTKHHKIALAGVATLGAAALAFSAVPSSADTVASGAPEAAARTAYGTAQVKDVTGKVTDQLALQNVKVEAIAAKKKASGHQLHVAHVKQAHAAHVAHVKQARAKKLHAKHLHAAHVKHAAAVQQAAAKRAAQQAASRSAQRPQIQQVAAKTYGNNLDGWIRQALDIMNAKGIPGSYSGLHRNIMRESSGNPNAINNWDINAINGIPSKGLLQVIPPTFATYHVSGTSWNIYDPVANITAAANYAAHRYGTIDNVNSAY